MFRHPVNPANSSRLLAVQLGHSWCNIAKACTFKMVRGDTPQRSVWFTSAPGNPGKWWPTRILLQMSFQIERDEFPLAHTKVFGKEISEIRCLKSNSTKASCFRLSNTSVFRETGTVTTYLTLSNSDQPPCSPPQRRSQVFIWNAHLVRSIQVSRSKDPFSVSFSEYAMWISHWVAFISSMKKLSIEFRSSLRLFYELSSFNHIHGEHLAYGSSQALWPNIPPLDLLRSCCSKREQHLACLQMALLCKASVKHKHRMLSSRTPRIRMVKIKARCKLNKTSSYLSSAAKHKGVQAWDFRCNFRLTSDQTCLSPLASSSSSSTCAPNFNSNSHASACPWSAAQWSAVQSFLASLNHGSKDVKKN